MTFVLAARRQIGYALGRAAGGLSWLLRDDFTTDLAAGSVNGTAAEPGPGGNRTVVDANNRFSISGGKFVKSGVAAAAWEGVAYQAGVAFAVGRTVIREYTWISGTINTGRFLVISNSSSVGAQGYSWSSGPNGVRTDYNNTVFSASVALSTGTSYMLGVVLRATGAFWVIKGGVFANWTLFWRETDRPAMNSTVYVGAASFSANTHDYSGDFIRVPDALWLPTPLASDGFGSAFGTTDGLGHAEGIAGGIGAGGGGVAWSNGGSTWSVSGGNAINTAPSGLSQQISVLSTGTANVFASVALTRSAGNVGLALSIDSASSPANGVLVYLDGTNCKVDKIVSGVTSNVRTTAVTYSAGARLVVAKNGTEYHVYYNNAFVVAVTISDAGIVNNTLHGMFSADASNTLDNFTCYATGTGGEYATLDQYTQ